MKGVYGEASANFHMQEEQRKEKEREKYLKRKRMISSKTIKRIAGIIMLAFLMPLTFLIIGYVAPVKEFQGLGAFYIGFGLDAMLCILGSIILIAISLIKPE